jgi:hypothetical protein
VALRHVYGDRDKLWRDLGVRPGPAVSKLEDELLV